MAAAADRLKEVAQAQPGVSHKTEGCAVVAAYFGGIHVQMEEGPLCRGVRQGPSYCCHRVGLAANIEDQIGFVKDSVGIWPPAIAAYTPKLRG